MRARHEFSKRLRARFTDHAGISDAVNGIIFRPFRVLIAR
jgi:hypothetical protein